jgi:hypothetical protein
MEEAKTEKVSEKPGILKKIRRFLLWSLISFCFLSGLVVVLVMVYEDDIKAKLIAQLNKQLNAEVKINPEDIDVTFISSFPKCALNFRNVTIMEALPIKQRDTLLHTKNLSLRFSIKAIFSKEYKVQQIWLEQGFVRLQVTKEGQENYIIWKSDTNITEKSNTAFSLEEIKLKNISLSYKNKQQSILSKLKINDCRFSGNFYTNSFEMESLLSGTLEHLKINGQSLLKNKSLRLESALQIKDTYYAIKKAELKLNNMQFNVVGNFRFTTRMDDVYLNYNGINLDIATVLSLLPESEQQRVRDYTSEGAFYASGALQFKNKVFTTSNSFGIKNATITYIPKNAVLKNVNLEGDLKLTENESHLTCKNINANINDSRIAGEFQLDNFKNPYLQINAEVQSTLSDLVLFYPADTFSSIQGKLNAQLHAKGLMSELQSGKPSDKTLFEGQISLSDAQLQFKNDNLRYTVPVLNLEAKGNSVTISEFSCKRGSSDLHLEGKLPNFLKYLFDKNTALDVVAKLQSEHLDLDDFLSPSNGKGQTSEILFPENNHFLFDATIKQFQFGKFRAENANGNIELKGSKLLLSDLLFETADGKAEVDALTEFKDGYIYFDLQSRLNGLNVTTLFTQLNNFGQNSLKDEHIKGFLTADITCSARWDKFLKPDLNSLQANAKLAFERGELNNFKPLESLSKFVELSELKRIKFSTLESEISIKEKTITIPKTALKNSALNIDFYGTHTFDNAIDYHIKLLLSELIAKRQQQNKELDEELTQVEIDPENRRSVFVLMTGNIDNPNIRYDRKGAKQKIKEDIKQEKQNLKAIIREELGWNKKDSAKPKKALVNPGFKLEAPKTKSVSPKQKEEEEDDF